MRRSSAFVLLPTDLKALLLRSFWGHKMKRRIYPEDGLLEPDPKSSGHHSLTLLPSKLGMDSGGLKSSKGTLVVRLRLMGGGAPR